MATRRNKVDASADDAEADTDNQPEVASAPPAEAPQPDPLDHDGDGKKGGSLPKGKAKAAPEPPAPKSHTIVALTDFSFPWNGTLISFRGNKRYTDIEGDLFAAMKASGVEIEER